MYIYYGADDKLVLPTDITVTVVSCGMCDCIYSDSMVIREKGRKDWSLFYCESGKVYFENSYISVGQIWIYPPNIPHRYTIYHKERSSYKYLHFTGSNIEKLLTSLDIPLCKPIDTAKKFGTEIFDKIREELNCGDIIAQLNSEYYTLRLISLLAADNKVRSRTNIMKRITDDMEHIFSEPYNAGKYAGMLNISVSRFNHLFKETVGIPPMAYYNKLRINNACRLLENTSMKINEIASCCGFGDPLYFSQAFKRITALSPASYRKLYKLSSN